jgi:Zn-dependent protease
VSNPAGLLLMLPPLLLALTVHEWSHGYVALRLGDPTARLLGRLTLNPLAHLDPLGSLLFFIPPHIGWARPVPVDLRYLRHPRRDMMWIALAGPASNLVLAVLFGAALNVIARGGIAGESASMGITAASFVVMVKYAVFLNLALMAFNLIPVFPLDGSRILAGLLSPSLAARYHALDTVGPIALLATIVVGSLVGFNPIGAFISPVVRGLGGPFTGGLL